MTSAEIQCLRDQTRQFGERYDYDVTYMQEMLEASPRAFALFRAVPQMAGFHEALPHDVSFVARIAAFSVVDCGPCLELSIKLGREAGVPDDVLHGARCDGEGLSPELAEVQSYAAQIAAGASPAPARIATLRTRYGSAGLVELALNIAGALVFPAVKRTLGHARSCALTTFSA